MTSRSYNYSSLVTAYNCQKLYEYLYIKNLKPEVEQTGDLAFGSAIHHALERHLSTTPRVDPVPAFEAYFDEVKKKNYTYGRYKHDELHKIGVLLLERFVRLHSKKIEPISIERRMFDELQGLKVEGTPDCIGNYEGVASVIDFKTSGYRYDKRKASISEQMHLYAHFADLYGIKQLVYIVFIKGSTPSIQTIKYEINKERSQILLDNIVDQIQDLEYKHENKKPYTRNPSYCIRGEIECPFYSKCWKDEE